MSHLAPCLNTLHQIARETPVLGMSLPVIKTAFIYEYNILYIVYANVLRNF